VINRILLGRTLRSFADGFIAIVLPAYLLALGMGQLEVGFISTATLLGSASMTLAVGRWGHRFSIRRLLLTAAMLMAATGVAFAGCSAFWPLLVVAFFGTLNPSSGDASVFMPLDHTMLATASDRTGVFARYSFLGTISGAVGALAAGLPEWLGARLSMLEALRLMFVLYAAVGVAVWLLYLRLPEAHAGEQRPSVPLGPSRGIVWRLAALFSVDSFAGGLVLNSLLALWLFERYGMSLAAAGAFFFWTGLLAACSQLAAGPLARRIAVRPAGAAAREEPALADGRAGARRFRHERRHSRRAARGGQLYGGAAQPGRSGEPVADRRDVCSRRDGGAARCLRRPEDRVRHCALRRVSKG